MAFEVPLFSPGGLKANGDLSAKQYHFVKITGALEVGSATADGEFCIGVLQNKPVAAGDAASVEMGGVTKVVVSEGITAGMFVGAANDGRAKVVEHTSTGADTADWVLGQALETATQANQLIAVRLLNGYRVTA